MNSAYLILVHKNFAQVHRLVERLLCGDVGVIVHVDAKVEIPKDFLAAFRDKHSGRVILAEKRFYAAWGSFEAVLAALSLLQEGLRHFPEARYLSLLSGQDYPIKRPEYLQDFFARNTGSFIPYRPMLEDTWKHGGIRRINRYYWAKNRKSLLGFFFRTIPFPPRRFPIPTSKLYVGSQWWSLRRETGGRILEFVQDNPDVLRAFRWTYIPDEMFFSTVLVGFLGEQNLVNDHLRFIEGFSLPRDYLRLKILNRNGIRNLGIPDLEKLRSSPALFARKFDATEDSKIFDLLDRF